MLAREIEIYLTGVRVLHQSCRTWVKAYGYAPYDYRGAAPRLAEHLCECCARPAGCGANGEHSYRELSVEECRARKIYHGGRCYHVCICTGCGHIESLDSSD